MIATAWKIPSLTENTISYRLQWEGIKGIRSLKMAFKQMSDWRDVGIGTDKDKNKILIFDRSFDTMDEWITWAKQFPFKLIEINRKGAPKPIKLGIDAKK